MTLAMRATSLPQSYWFKLEFPDHRWSVEERQFATPPREGETVDFGDALWRIVGTASVRVMPSGKPDRQFFRCQQA